MKIHYIEARQSNLLFISAGVHDKINSMKPNGLDEVINLIDEFLCNRSLVNHYDIEWNNGWRIRAWCQDDTVHIFHAVKEEDE